MTTITAIEFERAIRFGGMPEGVTRVSGPVVMEGIYTDSIHLHSIHFESFYCKNACFESSFVCGEATFENRFDCGSAVFQSDFICFAASFGAEFNCDRAIFDRGFYCGSSIFKGGFNCGRATFNQVYANNNPAVAWVIAMYKTAGVHFDLRYAPSFMAIGK